MSDQWHVSVAGWTVDDAPADAHLQEHGKARRRTVGARGERIRPLCHGARGIASGSRGRDLSTRDTIHVAGGQGAKRLAHAAELVGKGPRHGRRARAIAGSSAEWLAASEEPVAGTASMLETDAPVVTDLGRRVRATMLLVTVAVPRRARPQVDGVRR